MNNQNDDPAFDAEIERARADGGRSRGINRIIRLDLAASRLLQLADVVADARTGFVVGETNAWSLRERYGIEIA